MHRECDDVQQLRSSSNMEFPLSLLFTCSLIRFFHVENTPYLLTSTVYVVRREEVVPLLVSHLAFGAALPSARAGDGVTSGAAATAAARAAEAAAEAAEAAMETAVAAAAAAEVAAAAARSRSPAAAKRKLERSISTPAAAERLPEDPLTADSPAAAWYRQRKLKKVRIMRTF